MDSLEAQLNDFLPGVRQQALRQLSAQAGERPAEQTLANMHCHTFFSFNAYGYSPSGLAWLAQKRGYALMGIVDFDVLDGVDEFLDACDMVGVRGSAGLETRVYIPEFARRDDLGGREINSPGEPGIAYHMGIGFTSSRVPDGVAPILQQMRLRAELRNREMLERINAYLDPLSVDYDRDVLPLTPAGNATERHMLAAYTQAAAELFLDVAGFWSFKLDLPHEQVNTAMSDSAKYHNLLRAKLMKRGGVGYVQPGADSFPTLVEVHRLVEACGALPCAAWLDGTSAGEQASEELLNLFISQGVVAINIVPDRNWNLSDPDVRRRKVDNLYGVVEMARALDLPLNIGTEMNSPGQKLVDDFDAPELAPLRASFLDGAYFIYGHTALQRACGMGYQSAWAKAHLPTRRERNKFYTRLGKLLPPGAPGKAQLAGVDTGYTPDDILKS
jgi:hypothetical protein